MHVIIAGSRSLGLAHVEHAMRHWPPDLRITHVISGRAPGVDRAGEEWADRHGLPVVPMPAQWTRLGKPAGHIRNRAMGERAKAEHGALVLCWDGQSPGSANMLEVAIQLDLPHMVVIFPFGSLLNPRVTMEFRQRPVQQFLQY